MMVIANVFPKLQTVNITSSDRSVKTLVLQHALTVNMWQCPKNLQNLHGRTFFMCIHRFERS